MGKVQAAVNAVLANGHFTVPQSDAAVALNSGAINLNHVTLQGADGAQLALSGAIDLGSAAIDMRMTLSRSFARQCVDRHAPELSVNVKGPLASPQRTLDISALSSWLSLSAAELQTRRIELIEAAEREGAAGQAAHPAAPDVHSLSPGTMVESAITPNLLAAPPTGGRGIERLQPPPAAPSLVPAPPVIGPSGPRARNSPAATGAAQPNPRRPIPHPAGQSVPPAD